MFYKKCTVMGFVNFSCIVVKIRGVFLILQVTLWFQSEKRHKQPKCQSCPKPRKRRMHFCASDFGETVKYLR